MINLSGLRKKDSENKEGDFEIVFTGVRPGEKLYEELLIEDESIETEHPLIYRGNEKLISIKKLLGKV